jgi:uncharacterized surface protein with fasciclin (FAS1) repeats
MPASLFEPRYADKLALYVNLTIDLWAPEFPNGKLLGKLAVGRCADLGYGKYFRRENQVEWAPKVLMEMICMKQCDCDFGRPFSCKNKPDQPTFGKWCSLCGDKYNADAVVTLYLKGPGPAPTPAPTQNIVELASSIPTLSTLVTALKAASLTDTLGGPGPFTVFAPNNDAFAKIPPATLKMLLDPANVKELVAILEHHVIAGSSRPILAADFFNGFYSPLNNDTYILVTLFGNDDEIQLQLSNSPITQAPFSKVVTVNVEATNGVVHVIDTVLQTSR